MKAEFFCNSGANHAACRYEVLDTVLDLGLAGGEWESLTDDEKQAHLDDWNSGHLEMGWIENEENFHRR